MNGGEAENQLKLKYRILRQGGLGREEIGEIGNLANSEISAI
jgi:hypothetical protein